MRRGQIAVLLAFVIVLIALFALLNVDSFVAVHAKDRLQNAGDAAALAAARKQGSLLNEIGRLNIAHLSAAVHNDAKACSSIVMEQRRLALLGPVDALRLADKAARKNGMVPRDSFARILREHVADIRLVYSGGNVGHDPYPEPFPGAWTDYATAIENVVSGGLATGPDNIEFLDAAEGHLLLHRQFYMAIAAKDWCWFFFHCYSTLENYNSFRDWDPLPMRGSASADNSEVFSLHVASSRMAIRQLFTKAEIVELLRRFNGETVDEDTVGKSNLVNDPEQVWFLYDGAWSRWFNGFALAGDEDGGEFPLVGEIKEEYNVRGCAAVCRCMKGVSATAVDLDSDFTWSAAAKPFGTLEGLDGVVGPVTCIKRFVLPCFSDVRLVPLDSVGGSDLATADAGWIDHVRRHLPTYLDNGPWAIGDCFYCEQLRTWENVAFRQSGILWLKYNSGTCRRGSGGGGGRGGTSHGH